MFKWMITRKSGDFNKIAKENNISPVTARLLRNRDIYEKEDIERYLRADVTALSSPLLLKDMEKAVSLMSVSINKGDKIRIIGDYDVDGVCSSYILNRGISKCGGNVDVKLPHRLRDGYGLSVNLVDSAKADGVDTIITCDNGIAALDAIKTAKEYGMTVIVTDHHEVGYEETENGRRMKLPEADAVVDPKRYDNQNIYQEICGAVVAYKFVEALIGYMNIDADECILKELRVFAGWATVCDVMPMRDENRLFVLDSFENIKSVNNIGLNSLINATNVNCDSVNYYTYGFILGPCLNAAGRLSSAEEGLRLLMESDPDTAKKLAKELKALNDDRKDMTTQGTATALSMLEQYGDNIPDVIVLYMPDLHESLAGIIAGKVRETVGHPTIILTDGSAEGEVKGSGRSIEAYHMYESLVEVSHLLVKFGGHKLAAGLSLKKSDIDALRDSLNKNSRLVQEDFDAVLHLDMELPIDYINLSVAKEIEMIGPFGTGNPEPLFAARNVEILNGKILGANKNVGKYQIKGNNGRIYDMMVFQNIDKFDSFITKEYGDEVKNKMYSGELEEPIKVTIAYSCSINTYRNELNVQIIMKDFRKVS